MTDKATPTLRQRCDTALQSLPDAPYKTMLAVLFDDMTAEVERLAAQAAPLAQQAATEEIEAVIACLGDDAAQLREENPEDERADNMDRAAEMLSILTSDRAAAQAAPTEPKHPLLNITAKQLRAALDFANPDPDDPDQLEAKVCIQWGEARDDGDGGTEPAGLRAWLAECPEEGSISLDLWGTEGGLV